MANTISIEDAYASNPKEISLDEAYSAAGPKTFSVEDAYADQLNPTQPESLATRAGHYLRDNPVATAIIGPSERTRLAEGVPNPETGRLEYKPMGGEAVRQGWAPAAVATALKPIHEIPRVESVPDEGWAPASLHAAENTGIGFANALQSPAGVAALAFPEARVAMAAYMAAHTPSDAIDAYEAFKAGRKAEGIEKSVQAMFDVAGAADAKLHGKEAIRSTLPSEVVERPDSKQIATRMAEEQQTLRADDAAREALRPENAQRTAAENPAVTSERARQQAASDVALERQNQSEISTGPAVQPFEDAFTPVDQLYAEQKYGVGPPRRIIEAPGGMLDAPEFANKTEAAYRNESENVARATKESGVEEPVESKPVTPLPTDELRAVDQLTPSTPLRTQASILAGKLADHDLQKAALTAAKNASGHGIELNQDLVNRLLKVGRKTTPLAAAERTLLEETWTKVVTDALEKEKVADRAMQGEAMKAAQEASGKGVKLNQKLANQLLKVGREKTPLTAAEKTVVDETWAKLVNESLKRETSAPFPTEADLARDAERAAAPHERVKATLEADSAIRDAAGCL